VKEWLLTALIASVSITWEHLTQDERVVVGLGGVATDKPTVMRTECFGIEDGMIHTSLCR